MAKKPTAAQSEYEAAVEKLRKFCDDHTDLTPIIMDGDYPIRVQFIPDTQLSLFGDENIDENGEVNDLTVVVGLSTAVKSTLKFKMDSKLLKKLIKLAETVGSLYYHAFRAEQGQRVKPARPETKEEDGRQVCPSCGQSLRPRYAPAEFPHPDFCPGCGQAIDWTPDPETTEEDENDG